MDIERTETWQLGRCGVIRRKTGFTLPTSLLRLAQIVKPFEIGSLLRLAQIAAHETRGETPREGRSKRSESREDSENSPFRPKILLLLVVEILLGKIFVVKNHDLEN
jgi:hypothetical protein